MKITGENTIAASPQKVWEALNDPDVLRKSIPGCESLEKTGNNEFKATVVTKIGPVKTKFDGEVALTNLDPPHAYTIEGKGSGGPAGNARGSARVTLKPNGAGTLLSYDVDAQITGKLAQLGSRLIQSTARMLAGKFFDNFENVVVGAPAAAEAGKPAAAPAAAAGPGLTTTQWVYIALAAAAALIAVWVLI